MLRITARPDADILADAIEILAPQGRQSRSRRAAPIPTDEQKKWSKLFTKCMERMRIIKRCDGKVPAPAEIKKQLNNRFKRLQASRADLVAVASPKELIEAYDSQLRVVENILLGYQRAADHPSMRKRVGPHQPNMVASCAAAIAHDLLLESGQRVRWKQWHVLSALLYEAATGIYDFNLSKYMSMCKRGQIVRSRPAGGYFT
jgi:hypothetical protein